MQEHDIAFTFFRNEVKLIRKKLNKNTNLNNVTTTETQHNVTIRISEKKQWEFIQNGKIVLDEFENHRNIEGKNVKLFTQYLSILSGIAVHTKVHPVGTLPVPLIPEDSIV